MNRKRLTILALLIVAVFAFSALVACKDTHECKYDKQGYNQLYHWMECECGEKDGSSMERHNYDNDGVCTVCGYSQNDHEHVYGTEYKTSRTAHWLECTVPNCGNRKDQENHKFPTTGTTNKCEVCDYVRADVHVHELEPVDVQPATCSETGLAAHYICTASICEGRYFADAEGTEVSKTSLTLEIDPDNHNIGKVAAKDPTCTVKGNVDYYECAWCHSHYEDEAGKDEIDDETFNDDYVIVALGHDYNYEDTDEVWEVPALTAPGCTTTGLEQRTCQRAGCTEAEAGHFSTRAIPATGHDAVLKLVEEKAPTCDEPGWIEHYTCESCGTSFEDEEGELETENVTKAATGHKLTHKREVIATCTSTGMRDHWECGNCGKKFADQVGNTQVEDSELIIDIDNNAHPYIEVYHSNESIHWYEVTCIHKEEGARMFEGQHIVRHEAACLTCGYMFVNETPELFTYESSETSVVITGLVADKVDEANLALVIPSEIDGKPVVEIQSEAFKGNLNIVSVVINGVPKIGVSAFEGCKSLSKLTLLEGVRLIYTHAFYGCSSLKNVVFPESTDGIGQEAFMGTNLTWIVLDDYDMWDGFPDGEKQYFMNNPSYYPEAKIQSQAFPYTITTVYSRGTIRWEGQQAYSVNTAVMSASWTLAGDWYFAYNGEPISRTGDK